MYRLLAIVAASFAIAVTACGDDSDIGNACPMEVPASDAADQDGSEFPAIVEINTAFPCDSLTCVATSGRAGYCSAECNADANCPSAFECAQVNQTGPLSDRRFCVWRGCRAQLECGDVSKYDCIEGDYGPVAPPGLCGPIEDDQG